MGLIIIAGAIALFVLIFAVAGFKVVQQAEVIVIERLGKYSRTLHSGINIIWPIIDKPRDITWRYVVEGTDEKNTLDLVLNPELIFGKLYMTSQNKMLLQRIM